MAASFTADQMEYIFEQFAIFAFSLLALYIMVALPLILLAYIFSSVGYARMAKKLNIKARWLAWVPFARSWITGAIADKLDSRTGGKHMRIYLLCASLCRILGWTLGFMMIGIGIVNTVSILGLDIGIWDELANFGSYGDLSIILPMFLLYLLMAIIYILFFAFAFSGLKIIAIHKIFETLRPRLCLLHSTLGILIPLYRSICLLNFSKNLPEKEFPVLPDFATVTAETDIQDQ